MKRNIITYLGLIGLVALLPSCKDEDDKVVMSDSPVAPQISTIPDLTLKRPNGLATLVFTGSSVDPGFAASAIYYLEADTVGNNFANPLIISTSNVDTFKMTVSDLNGILIKRFPTDVASSLEFRVKSTLVASVGTGVKPYIYYSDVKTATATTYGLPRLNLIDAGVEGKIESALGDGVYAGYVKLDATKPFTLLDPDANVSYGATGNTLVKDGTGISAAASGWYYLTVDTKNLVIVSMDAYMIGLVGSATPNGWNTPDQKMDYDSKAGCWYVTTDLIDGEIKFRLNDGWAWNLGGTADELTQGGSNIAVSAGNYTIKLFINSDGSTGKCTINKN